MPQEEVCEFLMDREDWRFVRIIITLLCIGVMIVCIPFVCVKVKSAQMEAQGYEWVEGNCQCYCPSCECDKGHWAPISD